MITKTYVLAICTIIIALLIYQLILQIRIKGDERDKPSIVYISGVLGAVITLCIIIMVH